MGKKIRLLSLLTAASLASLSSAAGQSMVEHAAAAGGATAGAAAGKIVSDGLNRIGNLLGGAAQIGEPKQELQPEPKPKAEKPAAAKEKASAKSSKPASAGAGAIAVGSGIYFPEPRHATRYESEPESPAPVFAPVRVEEPRQARSEDLARVEPGMTRSAVLALGAFESRITIPQDDGHMLEVMQYDHTTVRVEDGKVTSISRN